MIRQASLPSPVRVQQQPPPVQPQQTRNYTSNNSRGTARGRGRGNGFYRHHPNQHYSQYQLRPIYVPEGARVSYPNHSNRPPLLDGPNYRDSQMVNPPNSICTDLALVKANQAIGPSWQQLNTVVPSNGIPVKFAPHLQPQMRFPNAENAICFNGISTAEMVPPNGQPLISPAEPENFYNVATGNPTDGGFNMGFYPQYNPYICSFPSYGNYYMQPNQFYSQATIPGTYGSYLSAPFGTMGTSNFAGGQNNIPNGTVFYNQLPYGQFVCSQCGKLDYFNPTDMNTITDP